MQLRLYRSNRNAQLRGDLLVLIAFDIVENEGEPGSFGQRRDCAFDIHPRLDSARPRGAGEPPSVFHREHPRRAPVLASRILQHRVDGKPVQPRRERGFAAEGVEPAPSFYEDILQQFCGVGSVAGPESKTERVDARRMLAIQELECIDIASLRAPNVLQPGSFVFSTR